MRTINVTLILDCPAEDEAQAIHGLLRSQVQGLDVGSCLVDYAFSHGEEIPVYAPSAEVPTRKLNLAKLKIAQPAREGYIPGG